MRRALGLTLSALTVTTLALSACSSDKKTTDATTAAAPATTSSAATTATSSAATTSTSATSPSASPTPSSSGTVSEAGQRYLSITAAVNRDATAFLALPKSTPIATLRAAAAKVAADYPPVIKALQAGPWPAAATGSLTALAAAAQTAAPTFTQCASAASEPAIEAVLKANSAKLLAQAAAIKNVRTALGLPPSS